MPYIGNPIYQSAFVTDTFSGNGSTTAFTMSVAPAGTTNVLVAISGVLQEPSTYGVVGTTITFSAAPPTGTGNISCRYLGVPATGVTTTAYRTVTEFTATAGQTTFTPPSYNVGFINVYRNGVLLGSADYTATNGTTVVLATGATSGDLVTVESFLVSSVLNAIPNTAGAVNSSVIATGAVTQAKLGTNVVGTGPAFSAYQTSGQSFPNSSFAKVTFNNETFDTNSNFASSTFTPTVAGYYQVNGNVSFVGAAAGYAMIAIYKSGTSVSQGSGCPNNTSIGGMATASTVVFCNGTTDTIELYGWQNSGGSLALQTSNDKNTFSACLVRAA